jgi:RNA polymerase sigma factor (sigma-70 family)
MSYGDRRIRHGIIGLGWPLPYSKPDVSSACTDDTSAHHHLHCTDIYGEYPDPDLLSRKIPGRAKSGGLDKKIILALRMSAADQLYFRIKERDQRAMAELYDQYGAALFGVILRIVRSREVSEDLLQDTFVKVWERCSSYDPAKASFYTWMLNVARNTALDKVRSAGYRHSQKIQDLSEPVNTSEAISEELRVDHIGLDKVLSNLESKYKTIIDLAYFQGYTQKEIHEELDIPLGTVKTRMRHAFRELRKVLASPVWMAIAVHLGVMADWTNSYLS